MCAKNRVNAVVRGRFRPVGRIVAGHLKTRGNVLVHELKSRLGTPAIMNISTMVRFRVFIVVLICSAPGCFLLSDFKKTSFDPGSGGQAVALRVPKGFDRRAETTDSAGRKTLTFEYGGGRRLYFTTDTGLSRWIDTAQHMRRPHLQGGVFYKGALPPLLFWREVYSQGLRYGYRGVPQEAEPLFDSSLNYLRVQ